MGGANVFQKEKKEGGEGKETEIEEETSSDKWRMT